MRVLHLVEAVDCGQVVNPSMAEGQVEGAAIQALGYALYERMPHDEKGRMQFRSFRDYTIATATDVPRLTTILVPSHEPTGPFGAKAIAEIPINGPAPAIAKEGHRVGARCALFEPLELSRLDHVRLGQIVALEILGRRRVGTHQRVVVDDLEGSAKAPHAQPEPSAGESKLSGMWLSGNR